MDSGVRARLRLTTLVAPSMALPTVIDLADVRLWLSCSRGMSSRR
jgi:hypothetical protein